MGQREPLGLFESVTSWSNKIFPFQFLNGNKKAEDSKKLDAQKEDNGNRLYRLVEFDLTFKNYSN